MRRVRLGTATKGTNLKYPKRSTDGGSEARRQRPAEKKETVNGYSTKKNCSKSRNTGFAARAGIRARKKALVQICSVLEPLVNRSENRNRSFN